MEWKLGQRFQLRLQVSTMIRISLKKKHSSWKFRDRDDSLVMVDVNGGGGRVMVPGNIMRDPRVFRWHLWESLNLVQASIKELLAIFLRDQKSNITHLLQIFFPTGSSFPQTSSTSCWPSGPRGSSGDCPHLCISSFCPSWMYFFQSRSVFHARLCTLSWSFPLSGTPSSPSTTSTTSPPAGWSMELSRQRFFANTWFSRSNSANFQLALCRRIKLQPDLDELIKQLGGPAPPPLPRGQVITHLNRERNKNQNELLSSSGSPTTPRWIRNVGTKGQLHCLCLWRKYLLQVWK